MKLHTINFFFIVVPGMVISYEKTVDYNGYKYRYVVTPTHTSVHWVDFYRAEQECVKWGGHLTSIHSQQELNFVKVHLEVLNFTLLILNSYSVPRLAITIIW